MDTTESTAEATNSRFNREDMKTENLNRIHNNNIDILGLSETKLNINNQNFAFKESPKLKYFSSVKTEGTQIYGSEIAIIMEKELAKYVGHITRVEEHILALHMLFKKSK